MPVEDSGLDPVLDNGLLVGLRGVGRVRLGVDPHRFDGVVTDGPVDGVEGHLRRGPELVTSAGAGAAERTEHAQLEDFFLYLLNRLSGLFLHRRRLSGFGFGLPTTAKGDDQPYDDHERQ